MLLDPGMIFGTGNHASTRMCMIELENLVRGGERVLDLGSGSGILSITALLLGAKSAVGVDIDPKAESIARENAAFNGLGADRFTALTGNVIAVIHRHDDVEDKWVVVPEGVHYTADQIREAVFFQERFFQSEVKMDSLFCDKSHVSAANG